MTPTLYMVIAVVGITATAIATRTAVWQLPDAVDLPPAVQRALRYAPACALAGIIGPAVLVRDGHVNMGLSNHAMIATLVGAAVFWRTRNMLALMGTGMAVLTILRLI